ncbi:amidophosphoribosyltransferase [Bacillus subtilis]|uniref:amidophosphoribosyltransferase n=1 Tax=Bacillus subtilis TaxID=1423 RepID=UPI0038733F66
MLAEIKGLNEECGVFGIWGHEEAPQITYYGLHSLQHRGQEGAGIVATDGEKLTAHKGQGLITEVFQNGELSKVKGKGAIGHVRYATAGGGGYENVQPLLFRSQNNGSLALAHNGNLVNATQLKQQLENQGSIFQTSSDTEVLAHLIKRSGHFTLKDQIKNSLSMLKGAYAFLIMTETEMIVALDPNGLRPLSIGMMGDAYVVASETCAFDVVGATYLREVEPGEMLIINDEGMKSERFSMNINRSICSMEYIYFSRPDSNLREQGVRMKLSAVRGVVEGKRVVMVDDSIVRGTTSRRIVTMLREAGATEVHVKISSPPIAHPCFYGIDTSTHEELIASSHSVEEIRQEIGADTLSFLSVEGLLKGIGRKYDDSNCGQCLACFTGKYPTEIYQDTVLPHVKEAVLTK